MLQDSVIHHSTDPNVVSTPIPSNHVSSIQRLIPGHTSPVVHERLGRFSRLAGALNPLQDLEIIVRQLLLPLRHAMCDIRPQGPIRRQQCSDLSDGDVQGSSGEPIRLYAKWESNEDGVGDAACEAL
jgi:hypothetical protein